MCLLRRNFNMKAVLLFIKKNQLEYPLSIKTWHLVCIREKKEKCPFEMFTSNRRKRFFAKELLFTCFRSISGTVSCHFPDRI